MVTVSALGTKINSKTANLKLKLSVHDLLDVHREVETCTVNSAVLVDRLIIGS